MGLCHAEGVKDIRNITPLLELANRNCIIVSDGDTPAKEKQKEFQAIHGYGVWKRYDEISKSFKAETGEDFIKEDFFKSHLEEVKKKNPSIAGNPTLAATGRMAAVKKWLLEQSVAPEMASLFPNELKHNIFDDLKPSDIDTPYYDFLKDFSSLVDTAILKQT